MKRTDRDGIKLPPLLEFRSIMADVTGEQYPADGDWSAYEVPNPSSVWDDDANGGESQNVERYVRDQGEVVKDHRPF